MGASVRRLSTAKQTFHDQFYRRLSAHELTSRDAGGLPRVDPIWLPLTYDFKFHAGAVNDDSALASERADISLDRTDAYEVVLAVQSIVKPVPQRLLQTIFEPLVRAAGEDEGGDSEATGANLGGV